MLYKFIIPLLIAASIFGILQFTTKGYYADPDGFYHAKVSQLLVSGDLTDSFPWMPYTTWAKGYADQHYLYHALLIPFNNAKSLPFSIILFSLMFCAAFLALIKKLEISTPVWWIVLLLLSSVDFLFRINLVKANTLSLVLMLFTLLLLLSWQSKKTFLKIFLLALASFVFVWTYGGFVFLPVLIGSYSLAVLVLNKKFDYLPGIAMLVGIGLGLALHPHHSNLLASLNNQLFQTGLGAGSKVPAGNEWLAYSIDWFVKSNIVILVVWLLSLLVFVKDAYKKQIDWKITWFQIMTGTFFILALFHRRFIEYYVPFAVLASALTLTPYFIKIKWVDVKDTFIKYWQFRLVTISIVITLALIFYWNFGQVYQYLRNGAHYEEYKEAALILDNVSSEGDMVLNTQWDQFPQLWYWNSKNNFIAGLDPTFLFIQDPDRYWKWRAIADDNPGDWEDPARIHQLIKEDLDSSFVFAEVSRNPNIIEFMDKNPTFFEFLYNNHNTAVYRVK